MSIKTTKLKSYYINKHKEHLAKLKELVYYQQQLKITKQKSIVFKSSYCLSKISMSIWSNKIFN
mgnify:CR=1 FL=1